MLKAFPAKREHLWGAFMDFGAFFEAFRLRSAAKLYARRLGPQLIHDYGGSDNYNEAQIRAVVRKLKLPERYIRLGFAAFMLEPEFIKLVGNTSNYSLLRNLYHRYLPSRPTGEMDAAGAYGQTATMAGSGLIN